MRLERVANALCDRRLVFVAVEEEIAAGDEGADVGEAAFLADTLEVGHRRLAGPADIHCAEQRDVAGHGSISATNRSNIAQLRRAAAASYSIPGICPVAAGLVKPWPTPPKP